MKKNLTVPVKAMLQTLLGAIFVLGPGCVIANAATPTTATQENFHLPSTVFSVRADGQELFTEHFKQIHYADFTAGEGRTKIDVNFPHPINSATVSPAINNIKTTVKGNNINFTLPERGWYVLTVNDTAKLFLFANEPQRIPAGKDVLSVMDFVSDATGRSIQTQAIQYALDVASETGKTLLFPRGIYLTGTLTIGSNTDIYLADGAMIKGVPDKNAYPLDPGRSEKQGSDNGEFFSFSRLLLVENAENVHIRGRGIIDGSGTKVRPQGRRANLIRIHNSRNVTIEGVILRDPASWNTHILHSEDVAISGVKLLNDASVPNTDGFDPDASLRVLIENCFAYCSDDNVAIKTTNNSGSLRDLKDITVRDNVFLTRKSSLKVGTESKASRMSDILFENNDIIGCDRAMSLYCLDGATFENIRFINNRIERNRRDRQPMILQFYIKRRSGKGQIKHVLVKDCTVLETFPMGSEIYGLDSDHIIEDVEFVNFKVAGKKIESLEDLGIEENPFTRNISFR